MVSGFRELRRHDTTIRPDQPSSTIVISGPYRLTRNPLYLSLATFYLGIGLWTNSLWVILLLVPLLFVMTRQVIAREEAYLERAFGDTYLNYKSQVRRWLYKASTFRGPSATDSTLTRPEKRRHFRSELAIQTIQLGKGLLQWPLLAEQSSVGALQRSDLFCRNAVASKPYGIEPNDSSGNAVNDHEWRHVEIHFGATTNHCELADTGELMNHHAARDEGFGSDADVPG